MKEKIRSGVGAGLEETKSGRQVIHKGPKRGAVELGGGKEGPARIKIMRS